MTDRKASLTAGKIGPAILAFILPMMLGSLIQQLYTMTDSVIVGQFTGKVGLAAINAALNPEDTDYLYYALNTATGKHEFFTNERDFNAFVATQDYNG